MRAHRSSSPGAKAPGLITEDGRRYLDLGSGIAVTLLGHANPDAERGADRTGEAALWHVSNLYQIPAQQELADRLVEATFADTVFFTNSGTEAAELAIKMARKYWYDKGEADRIEIMAFEGCFHGRSTAAIAASGAEKMVKGFGPMPEGFTQVPFGDHEAVRAAVSDKTCGHHRRTGAGRRRDHALCRTNA